MPYLHALSNFRDQIRAIARGSGGNSSLGSLAYSLDAKEILAACDRLRDQELADLGVLLDDREGKFVLSTLLSHPRRPCPR